MCGIVGLLRPGLRYDQIEEHLLHASNCLRHRGPDDSGFWQDANVGIGFAHRRLSVIDLTPNGHQPMSSKNGRYVITFNGEIYNYKDLMKTLSSLGHVFSGHSDTEVLLAGIEQWGVGETLKQLTGMFAFALWDYREGVLILGRDRLGIKPLYYGWVNSKFVFGSELKAFRVMPDFQNKVQQNALDLFLNYNYIPAPYSIYEKIFKLPPGTTLSIKPEKMFEHPQTVSYWSVKEIALDGQGSLKRIDEQSVIEQTEALLCKSIDLCMVSDVPLGVFLSGGIDSSVVAALMQTQSLQPIRTFTIGFESKDYNEAIGARKIAQYLGAKHTELLLSPQDVMKVIPRLPAIYDEPFADPSQIPTVLVSELAQQQVKVSLSGDGGDELFGGYKRYSLAQNIWQKSGWAGGSGRMIFGKLMYAVPERVLNQYSMFLAPLFDRFGRATTGPAADKFYKLASVLDSGTRYDLYEKILSNKWTTPPSLNHSSGRHGLLEVADWVALPDYLHFMMQLDMLTYLPDDILVKLDRASMSVGLEGRLPLLDHHLIEFLWKLPPHMKTRAGQSKWLLKEILYRHVPKKMIEQPKKGFGIPLDDWLRGPLRDWAENLLAEDKLKAEGYLDHVAISQCWSEHISGRRNWSFNLWAVLMFQAWSEEYHI